MEAVALLLTAMAKSDGDMSREQKNYLSNLFEGEFNLEPDQSQELIASSVFLLRDNPDINVNVAKVLSPSLPKFTSNKAASTLQWLHDIATIDSDVSSVQQSALDQAHEVLDDNFNIQKWQ